MSTKNTLSARDWNRLVDAVLALEVKLEATDWRDPIYDQTKEDLADIREAIRQEINRAPWGANGSVFVTYRAVERGSHDRYKAVWINGRIRATCLSNGWVKAIPADQAEEWFRAARTAAREHESAYASSLEEVGRILWRMGVTSEESLEDLRISGWNFQYGQMGGRFYRFDRNCSVSARGALRRARKIEDSEGPVGGYFGSAEELQFERRYHGARY